MLTCLGGHESGERKNPRAEYETLRQDHRNDMNKKINEKYENENVLLPNELIEIENRTSDTKDHRGVRWESIEEGINLRVKENIQGHLYQINKTIIG